MGRIQNSIELVKASWAVIRQDKELLALPVISAVASVLMMALFAVPVLATTGFTTDPDAATLVTFAVLFVGYVALAFVSIFFNSALIHAANDRMNGGDPTIGSALGGATGRIHRILPWALVSATVSQAIRALQERAGAFGAILGFLGGLAWSAVTFLVLPILVIEDVGPIDAVKRSARLLRQAWGEGLVGNMGMGLIGFVAALPLVLLAAVGVAVGTPAVTIPALALAVLGLIGLAIVMSALSVVYQTALYRFATNQPVSAFSPHLMQSAFRQK